jgi:hypothetical protein
MRRILLIVAVLLIAAAPAMATVTVKARHYGLPISGKPMTPGVACTACEVNYVCGAGEKVRAFALEITVDNGFTITSIKDFNKGENTSTTRGYGIFPGKFRDVINPADPCWADGNYNPIAPAADADASGTGLGTNKIIVELGSLYVAPNDPCSVGTLFRFDVSSNNRTAIDCNLNIALNTTRGGIVLEDGNAAPSPTLTGGKVSFPKTFPCWTPFDVQYNEWVSVWEPKCWSGTYLAGDANWRVQCWGDADGKYEGSLNKYRVYQSDYSKLLQAWGKKATALRAGMGTDGNWMCADNDHKYEGSLNRYRVYQSDYARLLQGWGKKDTQMRNAPLGWCPQ